MKPPKAKNPKALAERADELGSRYNSCKERMNELVKQTTQISDAIKKFATLFGAKRGKQKVIEGERFVVGVTYPVATPHIDYDKLFRLKPKLRLVICTLMPDSRKLEQAVAEGLVSRELLKKCLLPVDQEPTPRLYVSTKKDDIQPE